MFPYDQILPKKLLKDLKSHLINFQSPNSKSNDKSKHHITEEIEKRISIDSKLITQKHVELISKWIDRLEVADQLTTSYEFKLLYRAFHVGFEVYKFHEVCHNKPRTV